MPKHVVIIPGDDAAPEAMAPAVEILKSFNLDITWTEFPSGEEGVKRYGSRSAFDQALREAIDQSDTPYSAQLTERPAGSIICVGANGPLPMFARRDGDQGFAVHSKIPMASTLPSFVKISKTCIWESKEICRHFLHYK